VLECFRKVKESGVENNGDEEKSPLRDSSPDEEVHNKIPSFYIGNRTDLGSQISCCDESLISKEDEYALETILSMQNENGHNINESGVSNFHSAHKKRKMSSPATFAPSNGIEINSDSEGKSYNKTFSANNISRKVISSFERQSKLQNGSSSGELKCILENNILELHPEQENNDVIPENATVNTLRHSQTNDSFSSVTSGSLSKRYTEKRSSILSDFGFSHRSSQYKRSSSLARNNSQGAVQSYAKRRYSTGFRRTSSLSRRSQLGSEGRYENRRYAFFTAICMKCFC